MASIRRQVAVSQSLSLFTPGRVPFSVEFMPPRDDAADWARRLREAALKDSAGKELDGVIQTIKSFA